LRQAAGPASRVIARKGHIGYYAGIPVVPLPRFARLPELGDYARAAHADFLYFSWYEAQVRPEFAWLLDPTAVPPGLEIVYATIDKRSMLYKIGADFGREPAWLADPYQRRLHESRALVGVLPESLTVPYRITLGVDALDRGEPAVALEFADQTLRLRVDQPLAWQVRGFALMRLARPAEAVAAFERSLALSPGDAETRAALDSARVMVRSPTR
jgi:tetratricopeptide (TPR) repeat protein